MRTLARLAMIWATAALIIVAAPHSASASGSVGQWFWQNPLPQGNYLCDVAFAGDVGWAVGGCGAVVRTLSAGSFWAQQYGVPGAGVVTFRAVEMLDAQHVWLLREDGVVLISADGGDTWIQRRLPTTRRTACLYVASPLEAWAAGEDAVVWRTTDGGDSWHSIVTGGGSRRFVIHDGYLYPLGPMKVVRISMNTEAVEDVATLTGGLGDFAFRDHDFGLGATDNGTVVRTRDGGATLQEQPLKGLDTETTYHPRFGSLRSVVLVAGTSKSSWRSDDGGVTWQRWSTPVYDRYGVRVSLNIWMYAFERCGTRLFTVGSSGAIMFSKDDGATWHYVAGDFFSDLQDIEFTSLSDGLALTETSLLSTPDGGATWHTRPVQTTPAQHSFYAMALAPDMSGWIVGWKHLNGPPYLVGLLLHSNDGMRTFVEQEVPVPSGGISCVSTNDGVKAWAGGSFSGAGVLLRTADSGAHWRSCEVPPEASSEAAPGTPAYCDITFLSVSPAGIGYAVTSLGKVLRTTDDGVTWSYALEVHVNPGMVRMVDDYTVWIGAYPSGAWVNTWPSADWSPITVPSDNVSCITDVAALDDGTLLATAGQDIYRSDDAGATWWSVWHSESWLSSLAAAGGTDAWAAGTGGALLYNGGLAGDFTPPETRTHAPVGWSDDDSWVTLVPSDQTGIDATWWEFGEGVLPPAGLAMSGVRLASSELHVYKGPIKVTAEGRTSITYFSSDAFGNVEAPRTVTVKIDRHGPRVSSDCAANYRARASITLKARDGLSGVRSIMYRFDGGSTHAVRGDAAKATTWRHGRHTIVFWAKDKAGNRSASVTRAFFVH